MQTPLAFKQLSLAPQGAGDLIDRAVRLYRRHFMTLIRIAAPPIVLMTLGQVMFTVGVRSLMSSRNDGALGLLILFGSLVWVAGALAILIVMGGAARNLITHLLWGEPFTARTTYRNVRSRFGSLLGASLLIGLWVILCTLVAFVVLLVGLSIVGLISAAAAGGSVWVSSVIGVVGTIVAFFLAMVGFFFIFKFAAYVPQALMVEGRGATDAFGRSFSLARGSVRRLLAMFIFFFLAAYSALSILIVPLGWYGKLQGIDIWVTASEHWPMWYAISYSVLAQASNILILPVWILGLSLMYVDERVRQEGYDIELLAARQLSMPNVYAQPSTYYYYPQAGQYTYAPTWQQPQQGPGPG